MNYLTVPQSKLMDYLRDYQRENQSPPTRAEISAHFEWKSANAAEEHLRAIEKKGLIRLVPGRARGILIL